MYNFPKSINKAFEGSWDAYLATFPAKFKPSEDVTKEAFRLLLQDADTKVRPRLKVANLWKPDAVQFIQNLKRTLLFKARVSHSDVKVVRENYPDLYMVKDFTLDGYLEWVPTLPMDDFKRLMQSHSQINLDVKYMVELVHNGNLTVRGRIDKDRILIRYSYFFNVPLPMYKDVDRQIIKLWNMKAGL